jgi:hypothetical protein
MIYLGQFIACVFIAYIGLLAAAAVTQNIFKWFNFSCTQLITIDQNFIDTIIITYVFMQRMHFTHDNKTAQNSLMWEMTCLMPSVMHRRKIPE